MGFIVPIAFLTADYAAELREFLAQFRVIEIIDFEALRKITFRGVKRPTVAIVVENKPGTDTDSVQITTLSRMCYDTQADLIDFSQASVVHISWANIMSSTYHGSIGAAVDDVEAA